MRKTAGQADPNAIAERIRSLVSDADDELVAAIARRAGASESEVLGTIRASRHYPDAWVLAAIIVEFGIDPTWLLMGEYDAGSHRAALEMDYQTLARWIQTALDRSSERSAAEHRRGA